MKCAFVIAAFVLFFGIAAADELNNEGFEIRSERVFLQIYPQQNSISCIDTISIYRKAPGGEKLTLGLLSLFEIDYLTLNGKKKDFKRGEDIILLDHLPSDSVFEVIVSYSGDLSFQSDFCRISASRAVLREEIILPHCPEYLTYARFTIAVPKEWEALTAGNLVGQSTANDSTTYTWESKETNAEIGWICAGEFTSHKSEGSPPVTVHLFKDDSTASVKDITALVRDVEQFYSKKFSPFRFPKLDIVEVEDWVVGRNVLAIAAPSFIMVKKLAFETKDKFNQASSILPHEIAHQWWPLTVFINDEDAALLAEGMCEYSARMYNESNHALSIRDSLGKHPFLRPLILKVMQGTDIPLYGKANLRAVVTHYLKASYVHNMLRSYIGDSAFFDLYHQYATRFALKRVGTKDFEHLAEELSGKNLKWFFDQWVYNKGLPRMKIYNVHAKQEGDSWVTTGRVRLVGYDKFTAYIDVGIKTSKTLEKEKVWLGYTVPVTPGDTSLGTEYHNDVPFTIKSADKPLRALLDPDGDVLKIQKIPPKLGDLRDPGEAVMIVGTLIHRDHLLGLARKDSTAMDMAGWTMKIKFDSDVMLSDLQQAHVFLYGTALENSKVAELADKFPYGIRNDSVVVKNEVVYDSSLALTQIIDNPFFPNGSLCWVAPLSEKASPELFPRDCSWILTRGTDEISSGTWEVKDEDLETAIKS